jgi:alpha-1,6-mannosyltransferase
VRIVRLANFVMPQSGGLRTALRCLGEGYASAGHEPILIVPGPAAADEVTSQGRVITIPGPVVPGTGGYRVLVNRRRLTRLLKRLAPDRLEVSDRFTLRWTGAWARRAGVPSVMVSHESLVGLLRVWHLPSGLADRLNARTAKAYDQIVCTTGWAAEEFHRIGTTNLTRVPLGVDLAQFHPGRRSAALRARYARPDQVLIVHCSRLSVEKQPELAVHALRRLIAAGVDAVLVIVGDGPKRAAVAESAGWGRFRPASSAESAGWGRFRPASSAESAGWGRFRPASSAGAAERLPVHLAGFVPDRDQVAALLATADVALAPGPVETFGLAALEALASGTPVVVNEASALPEVIGDAGLAAPGDPDAFAAAVRELLARPEADRRAAARARAEQYGWQASVDGFLRAHGVPTRAALP